MKIMNSLPPVATTTRSPLPPSAVVRIFAVFFRVVVVVVVVVVVLPRQSAEDVEWSNIFSFNHKCFLVASKTKLSILLK